MIHETAVIDPAAILASDVSVGPYTIIGPGVEIQSGTRIGSHVVVKGPTKIGCDNTIYQFSSIGDDPQDKKYAGEKTWLEIGDRNTIREYCSINRGTGDGGGVTRIGNDNWIMAYCHIAHDCQIGQNTIFANNASLAGHVEIHDYAILGGFTIVHQFSRIGAHSFCAMGSSVAKDVPPYLMVSGQPAKPHGINAEGIKRRGFSEQAQKDLRKAYKIIYMAGNKLDQALEQLSELGTRTEEVGHLISFINESTRSIVR